MTVPSLVTAGTGVLVATGTGTVSLGAAGNKDDFLLLQVLQDGTGLGPTVPGTGTNSGFEDVVGNSLQVTLLNDISVGNPTAAAMLVYAARISADATDPQIRITTDGDDLYCRLYSFRNVSNFRIFGQANFPIESSGSGPARATSTTISPSGITTGGRQRLALVLVGVNDDNVVESFTGESGGDWTEATAEFASATGTDGCIQLQTAVMTEQGTISGGSYVMAASDAWGALTLALKPIEVPDVITPLNARPYELYS